MAKKKRLSTRVALALVRRQIRREPPRPLTPLPADTTARILVVNTTGIGDTIFCTAAMADLRESFPAAEIDILVDRRRVGLVDKNPRITNVIAYPGKYKQVRATIGRLRGRAYDVAIIQHANDPDVVPMVVKARPQHIVGYASHTFSEAYSVALPPADKAAGVHTIDARLALCKAVGAKGEHWHMELYPAEAKLKTARALVESLGFGEGQAIALNIGGSAPKKRWPAKQWTDLAKALSQRGLPAIVIGGPEDAEAGEAIRHGLGDAKGIHFAVGKLGLNGDIALLTLCRAQVSGDTGLLHAAYALDVPTVALFGPNETGWTGPHPKQPNAPVLQPPPEQWPAGYDAKTDTTGVLMQMISARDVAAALDKLLT